MGCFFKQKTAYEMRISDWSSDVCSADLQVGEAVLGARIEAEQGLFAIVRDEGQDFAEFGEALQRVAGGDDLVLLLGGDDRRRLQQAALGQPLHLLIVRERLHDRQRARGQQRERSEEHTSELQSLMRISYAVFCLKKKKTLPKHKA